MDGLKLKTEDRRRCLQNFVRVGQAVCEIWLIEDDEGVEGKQTASSVAGDVVAKPLVVERRGWSQIEAQGEMQVSANFC